MRRLVEEGDGSGRPATLSPCARLARREEGRRRAMGEREGGEEGEEKLEERVAKRRGRRCLGGGREGERE